MTLAKSLAVLFLDVSTQSMSVYGCLQMNWSSVSAKICQVSCYTWLHHSQSTSLSSEAVSGMLQISSLLLSLMPAEHTMCALDNDSKMSRPHIHQKSCFEMPWHGTGHQIAVLKPEPGQLNCCLQSAASSKRQWAELVQECQDWNGVHFQMESWFDPKDCQRFLSRKQNCCDFQTAGKKWRVLEFQMLVAWLEPNGLRKGGLSRIAPFGPLAVSKRVVLHFDHS